ncbi:hypothetical protein Trydic_g12471 [Trypoxylus dichotomus]
MSSPLTGELSIARSWDWTSDSKLRKNVTDHTNPKTKSTLNTPQSSKEDGVGEVIDFEKLAAVDEAEGD